MTAIDVIFLQVGTMRRKRAGKGLGLYQSKKKRKVSTKKCTKQIKVQCNVEEKSITSTEGYSCHDDSCSTTESYTNGPSMLSGDKELEDVLNAFSQISKDMITDISTEYSVDDYMEYLVPQIDVEKESEREEVMKNLHSLLNTKKHEYASKGNLENKSNDENHDVRTCTCHVPRHLQYAVDLIESKDKMIPLIKKMDEANVLDDFMVMLQLIADGTLDADNLPLLLAVERAKLQNLTSTTGMSYRPETLEFWEVFYRTCHGSGIMLASGKKNEGQVKAGVTKAGKLNPKEGFFNFAVPSIKTIIRQQKKIDKFMYAGIINGSFDLVNNMKEYVLEYDAKRIASGLGENEIGDVNLWGYEGPPSLQEAKEQLQEEIEIVDKISCMSNTKNSELLPLLGTLLNNIT